MEAWIRARNEHHVSVLSYFASRPSDLLVVDYVRDPLAAGKIARFVGFDGAAVPKPREHVDPRTEPSAAHRELVRRCAARLGIPPRELAYDILCPSLLLAKEAARFPADTHALT